MEPVFALSYSEYAAANMLAHYFKAKDGYSLFVPTSRQEKGIDLLLTKRRNDQLACLSFQVKSSRTYTPPPPKRQTTQRFTYYTWFNTFAVPERADFFLLFGLYPADQNRTKKVRSSWWNSLILAFSHAEMQEFIANVKTRGGKRDPMFGFGFDIPAQVALTRGDSGRSLKDFSEFILPKKVSGIITALDERLK